MTARSRHDDQPCQRGSRRAIGELLTGSLQALRRRAHRARRCEVRPDWLDDDGLQPAGVPRRPRGPRPAGRVALKLPEPETGPAERPAPYEPSPPESSL